MEMGVTEKESKVTEGKLGLWFSRVVECYPVVYRAENF